LHSCIIDNWLSFFTFFLRWLLSNCFLDRGSFNRFGLFDWSCWFLDWSCWFLDWGSLNSLFRRFSLFDWSCWFLNRGSLSSLFSRLGLFDWNFYWSSFDRSSNFFWLSLWLNILNIG
jgi:hypothetical protein